MVISGAPAKLYTFRETGGPPLGSKEAATDHQRQKYKLALPTQHLEDPTVWKFYISKNSRNCKLAIACTPMINFS